MSYEKVDALSKRVYGHIVEASRRGDSGSAEYWARHYDRLWFLFGTRPL